MARRRSGSRGEARTGTAEARLESGIYLARHGQSTWNAERRWTGHGDPPLTDEGRAQARSACATLRHHDFDAVGSSSLVRAAESASIISAELGLPLLEPTPELDERFAGPLRGLTAAELESRAPGFVDRWRAGIPVEIPGGEPWHAFVERALRGLVRLRRVPGRILVVSHMGVQRAVEQAMGRPPRWYRNLEGLWVGARELDGRRSAPGVC